MTTVRASAPGKLFLLGEYAVLEGAPALLAAVAQRAVVTATHSPTWRLRTRGLHQSPPEPGHLELGPDGALPSGLDEATARRLALVDEVRRGLDGHYGTPGPKLDIVVDSSAFRHDGHKLGLGSSAAVAVALTAALAQARGHGPTRETLFRLADSAHRAAQGGTGSGGDVAASTHGGTLLYTRGSPPTPVELPAGIGVAAVTTGTGSSTVQLVGQVNEYRARDPESHRRDLNVLAQLAASTSTALRTPESLLALADDWFGALETLARHSGAQIVTETHHRYRKLAAASGAVFKPSGAGGGDLGLVFAKLEDVDALQCALTEDGAHVIPLPTRTDGARIDAA